MNVTLKIARAFQHVAQDALGRELVVVCPGHFLAVLVKSGVEQILERLFIRDVLDVLQALLILDAVSLHFGHRAVARGALLCAQHLLGILERCLDHRDQIHGIGLALGVEQLQRGKQERRERLIECEVLGQIDRQRVVGVWCGVSRGVRCGRHLGANDDAGIDERGEDFVGANLELGLFLGGLQACLDEVVYTGSGIAALLDHANHHGVRDAQARFECLGLRLDQTLKGLLVPGDKALGGLFLFNFTELLGVVARLGHELGVLDLVLRGLGNHHALGIEARAAGATGNLMELAGAQTTHLVAIELGERGEHHGVDGYVDADAERIGAADDGQQTLLRQALDQQAIARQHASMVHADAASKQALENLAKGRREARSLGSFLNGLALLLAGDAKIGERLCRRKGGILAKVHDIERGLAAAHGELDRALEGGRHIVVAQRNGTRGIDNQVASSAGVLLERGGDRGDIAERGAHEHELRVGQGEQRHLPGPTAVGVGKVVKLVHGDAAHVGVLTLAQRIVGKDFGRAADDGRLGVDMRVAGDHADVIAAEHLYQIEELFADQGLDRGRVITAFALCHAHKEHA